MQEMKQLEEKRQLIAAQEAQKQLELHEQRQADRAIRLQRSKREAGCNSAIASIELAHKLLAELQGEGRAELEGLAKQDEDPEPAVWTTVAATCHLVTGQPCDSWQDAMKTFHDVGGFLDKLIAFEPSEFHGELPNVSGT